MLEELIQKAEETDADMVICDYYTEDNFGLSLCATKTNRIVKIRRYHKRYIA